MKYKIALEMTAEGYSVSVPGHPGCWSQGKNAAEAIANIRDAISEYLSDSDELLQGVDVREVELEVIPHSHLVWTNEEEHGGNTVTTVVFEEIDGKTLVVLRDLYPSAEALDAASPFASEACDRLRAYEKGWGQASCEEHYLSG